MTIRNLLIVGGTSSIARAIALEARVPVYLASRDSNEQSRIAADLHIRTGQPVYQGQFLANDADGQAELMADADYKLGGIDCVIVASGELGDQNVARMDAVRSQAIISSNFFGIVPVLTHAAALMEERRRGCIAVLSSVAGDRGRQSNYVYGSAKAGVNAFLQGLRNRLYRSSVNVLTVKLGFTDTKMTWGKSDMFLTISPEQAAQGILKAIRNDKDIVYVPGFWRMIMLIIRSIPEPVFKRLNL